MSFQTAYSQENIRKPAVAGMFYPADLAKLSSQIGDYLNHAKIVAEDEQIFGLVAPHAGYIYSGIVAAQAYKQLIGRSFDAVVVISPSHVDYFPFTSVMAKGYYETPLGKVKIDEALSKKIASNRRTIQLSAKGHFQSNLPRQEHALEVQLPFLQKTIGDFSLVAIVMGEQSHKACEELANALVEIGRKKKILIVASSDLSHFHSYDEAKNIDSKCVSLIKEYEIENLFKQLKSKNVEACGGGPIVSMLMATKKLGADKINILMYANSGDTAGDRSSVVGYVSAIAVKSKQSKKTDNSKEHTYSEAERYELLQIARTTIQAAVLQKPFQAMEVISEKLKEKRGAFVTINKFGQLRGCIGYTQPIYPLYETIQQVAKAAALEDPRFPPVSKKELDQLELEISVLTLPQKINDINTIKVGTHGLIIKKGFYQGLLLPQVATDYGWDRITFLEQTCRKAGLPKDAWKDSDAEIYIFSAEVFGEQEQD